MKFRPITSNSNFKKMTNTKDLVSAIGDYRVNLEYYLNNSDKYDDHPQLTYLKKHYVWDEVEEVKVIKTIRVKNMRPKQEEN
tara:strand:+ start:378 stop:623 length:246 start_codon:yes stop_codon:yes gene_type:complete